MSLIQQLSTAQTADEVIALLQRIEALNDGPTYRVKESIDLFRDTSSPLRILIEANKTNDALITAIGSFFLWFIPRRESNPPQCILGQKICIPPKAEDEKNDDESNKNSNQNNNHRNKVADFFIETLIPNTNSPAAYYSVLRSVCRLTLRNNEGQHMFSTPSAVEVFLNALDRALLMMPSEEDRGDATAIADSYSGVRWVANAICNCNSGDYTSDNSWMSDRVYDRLINILERSRTRDRSEASVEACRWAVAGIYNIQTGQDRAAARAFMLQEREPSRIEEDAVGDQDDEDVSSDDDDDDDHLNVERKNKNHHQPVSFFSRLVGVIGKVADEDSEAIARICCLVADLDRKRWEYNNNKKRSLNDVLRTKETARNIYSIREFCSRGSSTLHWWKQLVSQALSPAFVRKLDYKKTCKLVKRFAEAEEEFFDDHDEFRKRFREQTKCRDSFLKFLRSFEFLDRCADSEIHFTTDFTPTAYNDLKIVLEKMEFFVHHPSNNNNNYDDDESSSGGREDDNDVEKNQFIFDVASFFASFPFPYYSFDILSWTEFLFFTLLPNSSVTLPVDSQSPNSFDADHRLVRGSTSSLGLVLSVIDDWLGRPELVTEREVRNSVMLRPENIASFVAFVHSLVDVCWESSRAFLEDDGEWDAANRRVEKNSDDNNKNNSDSSKKVKSKSLRSFEMSARRILVRIRTFFLEGISAEARDGNRKIKNPDFPTLASICEENLLLLALVSDEVGMILTVGSLQDSDAFVQMIQTLHDVRAAL